MLKLTIERMLSMKINGDTIGGEKEGYVIKRTGKNNFRLGEMFGDWIMSGTANEVLKRYKAVV
jgi:hypothetical protein